MLQKKGNEVSIFTLDCNEKWCEFEDCRFPVINLEDTTISGKIDYMIATMWTTVKVVEEYPYAVNKYYLVQNYEAGFTKRQIRCVYGRISLTDHRQT